MLRTWVWLLALCGACANDPCEGVDGTCVALSVSGPGAVDGLVFQLSGAATGTRVGPSTATVSALPVSVALQLGAARSGRLHIVVEGVLLGGVTGKGAVDIDIAAGAHTTAGVALDPSLVDGGVTANADLSCPDAEVRCAGQCCAPGMICGNGGTCAYASAELYVYLCPSFNSGCSASTFSLSGTCNAIQSAAPGACNATGLRVAAGTTYQISACAGCNVNCSSGVSFTTPAVLTASTYFAGTYFFCGSKCTPPSHCP